VTLLQNIGFALPHIVSFSAIAKKVSTKTKATMSIDEHGPKKRSQEQLKSHGILTKQEEFSKFLRK
jgi:hypothetical protein